MSRRGRPHSASVLQEGRKHTSINGNFATIQGLLVDQTMSRRQSGFTIVEYSMITMALVIALIVIWFALPR